jgi:hypothetical protein
MTAEPAPPPLEFAYEWKPVEHARARHVVIATRLKDEGLGVLVGIFIALLLIGDAIAVWFALQQDQPIFLNIAMPVTLVVLVLLWIMLWGQGWVDALRQRRNDSSLQYPIQHILNAHGLRVRKKTSEVALRWKAMVRVTETPEFMLFFYSHGKAYYLPKRAISAGQLDELRALIRANVGDVADLL